MHYSDHYNSIETIVNIN